VKPSFQRSRWTHVTHHVCEASWIAAGNESLVSGPLFQSRCAFAPATVFTTAIASCRCTALSATATNLEPNHSNLECPQPGDFRFQTLKHGAREFLNLAALKARQMNVVDIRFRLVEVLLTVQMHQIQFVNQTQLLEKLDGSVNRRPIDPSVVLLRHCQQRGSIEMAIGFLDRLNQDSALTGNADTTQRQFL
jgi:hypothetical protein